MSTGNKKRDKHLNEPDFFDTAKFPTAIYYIDTVKLNDDTLSISGRFLLRGVEKPMSLNLKRTKDSTGWLLVGQTTLEQKDYGMVDDSFLNPVKSKVVLKFKIALKPKA